MIPRGLGLAVVAGMAGMAALGLALEEVRSGAERQRAAPAEGPSLSVVPQKRDHAPGEPVVVVLANAGSVPLEFRDSSYGLRVTQLDGAVLYEPPRGGPPAALGPGEEAFVTWNQTKGSPDGPPAAPGTYRVSASARAPGGGEESASATVNVLR